MVLDVEMTDADYGKAESIAKCQAQPEPLIPIGPSSYFLPPRNFSCSNSISLFRRPSKLAATAAAAAATTTTNSPVNLSPRAYSNYSRDRRAPSPSAPFHRPFALLAPRPDRSRVFVGYPDRYTGVGPIRDLSERFALSCSLREAAGMDEMMNGGGAHGRPYYGGGGRKRRYRGEFSKLQFWSIWK